MNKESTKGTPDQKIAHKAKVWRELEKQHEGDKASRDKQRAEYRARRDLSDTIDSAKEH